MARGLSTSGCHVRAQGIGVDISCGQSHNFPVAPIPRKYVAVYALLFVGSVGVAIAGAVADGGTWIGVILQTGRNLEPLAVVAAPLAYAIVEVSVMLAEIFLKKREEKGRTEGRAEVLELVASKVGLTEEQRKAIEEDLKASDK